MPNTQDLRRKIKSVQATGKLTRAMQMVAASKMSKAVQAVTASRAYADLAWSILGRLATRTEFTHPLFISQPAGRPAIVIITSNRGLAGSFNSQVIRKTLSLLTPETEIISVGRKGLTYFKRFKATHLAADFPASNSTPRAEESSALASFLMQGFTSGEYREIKVVYNRFLSAIHQEVTVEQVLPILHKPQPIEVSTLSSKTEFLLEPDPATVLAELVRRIVPLRLYQMLLDSSASEHSARMVAMKNATDNAEELVGDLTLTYQGVRQASITRQIIEVSSGAAVLIS
ncbi:ATP synthase F1 subunit gamma [Candidatus Berkelbacteria bacterium]|nr:ATP synthase F1 subunit gamma [Candidatus Berkelbacteria bacterium]